jgi:hypothetical protein
MRKAAQFRTNGGKSPVVLVTQHGEQPFSCEDMILIKGVRQSNAAATEILAPYETPSGDSSLEISDD